MRNKRFKILLNHVAEKLIYIGIVFAVLFWIVEPAIHVFVFHEGSITEQILTPCLHDIWMRLLVMGAIIIFAIFAKFMVNRHKRAEKALLASKMRFRLMIEKNADAILVVNSEGTVRFANPAAEFLFGLKGEELVGRMFGFPLITGESTEINIIRRLGEIATAKMRMVEIEWEGKIGYLASLHDISERKLTEEALKKSHDELEKALSELRATQVQMIQSEKMASIGQLAAGIAHEINNPTGFVSSNLKTLSDYQNDIGRLLVEYRKLVSDLKDNMAGNETLSSLHKQVKCLEELESEVDIGFILDDTKELIKESQEGTERIKKIVLDLKDFAHPGEQEQAYTDINKNIESTLNVVWNELKYKATVTKEYGDLPLVECYSHQLNQVFMNLLVNAAQAIEQKGEIKIVTRAADGYVEIKISDTGSGIPKETLSKIFDPFFTTKEVGKGTGLGLNVAYNIIEKHNGTIEVESTVGKGTTFTIRIPIINDQYPEA